MNKLLSFCLSIVASIPFWLLYRLSDVLFLLLYYLVGYRKKVVYENLRKSFPEKTEKERKQIARKFYRYLADLMLEVIKLSNLSRASVLKRVRLENPQEVLHHLNRQQSVHILTAHYGNWEWGIPRLALLSKHPALVVYKPLSNRDFEEVFNRMRTRHGGIMVPMKSTLRAILERKDTTHCSVFLSDQTPSRSASTHFIPFLNQSTPVFKGIEKIARKTNYPIIYCHINRIKRGYYSARFTTLLEEPKNSSEDEVTRLHTQFLEDIIKQKPELWLWSHKRWKYQPTL